MINAFELAGEKLVLLRPVRALCPPESRLFGQPPDKRPQAPGACFCDLVDIKAVEALEVRLEEVSPLSEELREA